MNERPLTLEEIHEGTLEILKKIISICDETGVNYFLAYGTLIGAVRHGGFIPWDDDLDLVMLRPDYEKFLDYCRAHEAEMFPFRLMNRRVMEKYVPRIPEGFNLSNVMLSVLLLHGKEKVLYLPITFRPRQGGVNSINLRRIVRIGRQAVVDFWHIRREMKKTQG